MSMVGDSLMSLQASSTTPSDWEDPAFSSPVKVPSSTLNSLSVSATQIAQLDVGCACISGDASSAILFDGGIIPLPSLPPLQYTAVAREASSDGGDASSPSPAQLSAQAQIRRDALIGVASALGAVSLIFIAFLFLRAARRRRDIEASEPAESPNASSASLGAHASGQQLEASSVHPGQRRKSKFFLAGDALETHEVTTFRIGPDVLRPSIDSSSGRERKPLDTTMISKPILGQNTMDW